MFQGKQTVVTAFRIRGLHGYKDVAIEFERPAKVVIAENGTGKTAILFAMHAFLQGEFGRLRRLRFDSIECEMPALARPIVLTADELPSATAGNTSRRLERLASFGGMRPESLRDAIAAAKGEAELLDVGSPLHQIYIRSPYSMEELLEEIRELRSEIETLTPRQAELTKDVAAGLAGCDVLYLPTYRRVELPLVRDDGSRPGARSTKYVRPRAYRELEPKWDQYGIQFGLTDVEERITFVLNEIQKESNLGYRAISANIVDELLRARIGAQPEAPLPDIDALSRFLGRIEQRGAPENRLQAVKRLYESGDLSKDSNVTLRYFLSKLSIVVEKTREQEASIEQFVERANRYLRHSSDEKKLVYDASRLKVVLINEWTGSEVRLDDMSSGEKQVISLLAFLYLYSKPKLVLIDEPELSLSIDWQRMLLPDVMASPTCRQLLAITHSPFIFENDLDPVAGPLSISRRRVSGA